MKADNTSCIVVLIDPLGPRKLSILKKKRDEFFQKANLEKTVASPRVSPRKHDNAAKPEAIKSEKDEENKKKSATIRVNSHNVITPKTVVSPISTEKSKRSSISPALNSELDDSVQANSVHFKAKFSQGMITKEKLNFSCTNVFARFHGSKSDLDVHTSTQGVPITRARHHSGNVILQSQKLSKTSDQNQKVTKNNPIFTASSLKDLSVLTDSLKPYQTNRVHLTTEKHVKRVEVPVSACSLKDMQNFLDCSKNEIKVRTNSDMNQQRTHKKESVTKDQKPGAAIKSDSAESGGHYLRKHTISAIDNGNKKATCVASKLRKVKQRSLRCRGQVENKVKASMSTIAGVKRKRNSNEEAHQPKKTCRR